MILTLVKIPLARRWCVVVGEASAIITSKQLNSIRLENSSLGLKGNAPVPFIRTKPQFLTSFRIYSSRKTAWVLLSHKCTKHQQNKAARFLQRGFNNHKHEYQTTQPTTGYWRKRRAFFLSSLLSHHSPEILV